MKADYDELDIDELCLKYIIKCEIPRLIIISLTIFIAEHIL